MKDLFITKMSVKPDIQDFDIQEETKRYAWTETSEQRKKSCLKQIFRPILFMMALSGCYNFSDLNEIVTINRPWTVKMVLSYIYRLVVFLMLLFMGIRFIVAWFYLPPEYLLMNGLCSVWVLSLMSNFLVSLKASSLKYGHYEAAFQLWEEKIIPEYKDLQFKCPVKKITQRVLITTTVACVFVAINFAGLTVQVFKFNSGPFFLTPLEVNIYSLVMLECLLLIATLIWIIPQANAIIISRTMTKLFQSYNKYLKTAIEEQSTTIQTNLQRLRLLHMDSCKLVSEMDKDLGWFYGLSFAMNIFLCVFSLYQIMKTEMDTFTLALYIFWFFVGILVIGITATFAALLNDEVSKF